MTGVDWKIDHHVGSAGEFHALDLPDPVLPALWWFEVDRPTVVLGSTQADALVDRSAAAVAGVAVARRRSGGGAVWLAPGEVTWVDVVLPVDHRRWEGDVGRAPLWLGAAWARVLAGLGAADGVVHEGPMVTNRWSSLVCFAGLGPGEVTVGGRKVVGISQRRTRSGARFQCAVLNSWDPGPLLGLTLHDPAERAAAGVALATGRPRAPVGLAELGVAATGGALVAALQSELLG